MIGYLRGDVEALYEDSIILETFGVGYNIMMPNSSIASLRLHDEDVKIYTYLSVREDAMLLYGFLNKNELDLFKKLITVTGIGPKGGLMLMSFLGISQLKDAIVREDAKLIAKTPGIGAKTAQRLIIDLKDKLDVSDIIGYNADEAVSENRNTVMSEAKNEAIEALCALGYAKKDAMDAIIKSEASDDETVEEILKKALKCMSRI